MEADGEGSGSRGGVGEAARIRRRNLLARCGEVEVELQPWKLTVRAVAPAAAAGGEAAGIQQSIHFLHLYALEKLALACSQISSRIRNTD